MRAKFGQQRLANPRTFLVQYLGRRRQATQLSDFGLDLPSVLDFLGESELLELAGLESLDLESLDLESLDFDSAADLSALAPFL